MGGISPLLAAFLASSAAFSLALRASSLCLACAACAARCDAAKCSSCGAGGMIPCNGAPG